MVCRVARGSETRTIAGAGLLDPVAPEHDVVGRVAVLDRHASFWMPFLTRTGIEVDDPERSTPARCSTRATVSPMWPNPITRMMPSATSRGARRCAASRLAARDTDTRQAWLTSERNGVAIIVMIAAARNVWYMTSADQPGCQALPQQDEGELADLGQREAHDEWRPGSRSP